MHITKPLPVTMTLISILAATPSVAEGWQHIGGDAGGSRHAELTQITPDNVAGLELAWTYRTGAVDRARNWERDITETIDFQATPILLPEEAGGHLIICTPFSRVIALNPATGKERWIFDPDIDMTPYAGRFKCKGAAYWQYDSVAEDQACRHRLFLATPDRRLIAFDARDGRPCESFGDGGTIDVTPIMAAEPPADSLQGAQLLSPPAVVNGIVVISHTASKFKSAYSMRGSVRAFDGITGEYKWSFDPLVRDPDSGYEPTPLEVGGGNVWSLMSVDNERDLIFLPTASPAPNYWGVHRPGDNRWADSTVALRGATGKFVWGFQVVHHDLWDRDNPAQPIAVDIVMDGEVVPAVIQLTKVGLVFAFHRETGEPLFPIEERPVPTGGIAGEQVSPTQPFPVKPPSLVRNTLSPDDAWGLNFLDRNACRKKIASMRHGHMYEPPSEQGVVMYPQPGGGSNWAGGTYDNNRHILVTPVSEMPFYVKFIPEDEVEDPQAASGPLAGNPMQGPGFMAGTNYALEQGPLMSPSFTPCTAPPWASLVAVDMSRGEILWKVPFGVLDKMMPIPIPLKWGPPFAGGPISTSTGLVFIGASSDARVRAFDIETGEELWVREIPTSAQATPMTYMRDGRQYVVFAAGGHSWFYPQGIDDYVLAFALPEAKQ